MGGPRRAGPARADPSSIVWVYHSHTPNVVAEIQAGLSGVLVIVRKGQARYDADGRPHPKDVDGELVTLWAVFDENRSVYYQDNIDDKCGGSQTCLLSEDESEESKLMHSINGLLWTDGGPSEPMYRVDKGDTIRVYIGALRERGGPGTRRTWTGVEPWSTRVGEPERDVPGSASREPLKGYMNMTGWTNPGKIELSHWSTLKDPIWNTIIGQQSIKFNP